METKDFLNFHADQENWDDHIYDTLIIEPKPAVPPRVPRIAINDRLVRLEDEEYKPDLPPRGRRSYVRQYPCKLVPMYGPYVSQADNYKEKCTVYFGNRPEGACSLAHQMEEVRQDTLQYLDLDLPASTPPTSKSSELPRKVNKITHGKSKSAVEADSAYKTVDFLKTEAFNITRQDAEAHRSYQC